LFDSSTKEDILEFFRKIIDTKDDFILRGYANQDERNQLIFNKISSPTHLVMKHVRYLHIINNLLNRIPDFKVIGIIRHPCATINSWINCKREFSSKWNDDKEWRKAEKKNKNRVEEYFGFNKWKEGVAMFEDLVTRFPDRFYIQSYSDLLNDSENESKKLFEFANLNYCKQTSAFISKSREFTGKSDYSVFRSKDNDRAWENELSSSIIKSIEEDLLDTKLEKYLLG
tara:strand:+ start:238 stop:921 length:684 start_codon:yes stop_codon:yes gene_type:complete